MTLMDLSEKIEKLMDEYGTDVEVEGDEGPLGGVQIVEVPHGDDLRKVAMIR